MNENTVFSLQGVEFSYPDGTACLGGIDLCVQAGDFVLISGPSGGGKSTLLRLLACLERPERGTMLYLGNPLEDIAVPRYRREVCLIQQTPVVVSGSVRDNLLVPYAFKANQEFAPPDDEALRHGLETLLLESVTLDSAALALSVGQRQRLCLLRAWLLGPRVMLMDEPTSALDPESRAVVEAEAERLCRDEGVTVIMVSHNEYVPSSVPFRRFIARDGQLQEGS